MKKERLHPEITCPHCRTGFGGHKDFGKEGIVHLDIAWSYESALTLKCQQEDIKEHIAKMDDNGNPTFEKEFDKKLKELREKFETNPDDIDKNTYEYNDYYYSFVECINWGEIEEEDEEFDRESMTGEKLEEMYNNGVNLKDAVRSFIIKIKE